MKRLIVGISCVVAFCSAVAQDVITAKSPADTTTAQSHTLNPIETALKKYVTAYDSRNVPELLTVWPDLQNQKKDFDKIRDHLTDGRIADEHMTLRPLESQTLKDDAIVRCERTEQFTKTETRTDFSGDLNMGSSPVQSPPPSQRTSKKAVKKTDKVWIKLHKNQDDWLIVSISEKLLSF